MASEVSWSDRRSGPSYVTDELNKLKAIVAKRTAADLSRFQWWSTGGPVYRWTKL